eukprot:TRINITY_DN16628_c0_g1_i1.p1 TRINITY_DN16628_c0_g1~~TRINITY_DN16628_c0_g1_i1.p1  ORF type:complete len:378 (-),score=72.65 TRINITY_DN16628_c0_g1_i1:158-1291(-)
MVATQAAAIGKLEGHATFLETSSKASTSGREELLTESKEASENAAKQGQGSSEALPMLYGISMKWISLVLLVLQTVGVIFAIRLSRAPVPGSPLYLMSSAVFSSEVLKFVLSLTFLLRESSWRPSLMWRSQREQLASPASWLRTAAPCFLYTVQNNMLFVALSNLPGAEYQVTYQLKILSTALLSTLILGRRFSTVQWMALFLLTGGVSLIQMRQADVSARGDRLLGLGAVLCACLTSGLAGVLMEVLMKRKGVSMWLTNLQVALVSMVIGLAAALMTDGKAILEHGMFQGYSGIVWLVVWLQAGGGLVIASVMKYADNVLKCFGNALSISASCLVSAYILDEFELDQMFAGGTALVVLAIFLYSVPSNVIPKLKGA